MKRGSSRLAQARRPTLNGSVMEEATTCACPANTMFSDHFFPVPPLPRLCIWELLEKFCLFNWYFKSKYIARRARLFLDMEAFGFGYCFWIWLFFDMDLLALHRL